MGEAVRGRFEGPLRLARGPVWHLLEIIPRALEQLMGEADPKRSGSVIEAMLQMDKIDIAGLRRAYDRAA